jgi:hypothetical protein
VSEASEAVKKAIKDFNKATGSRPTKIRVSKGGEAYRAIVSGNYDDVFDRTERPATDKWIDPVTGQTFDVPVPGCVEFRLKGSTLLPEGFDAWAESL